MRRFEQQIAAFVKKAKKRTAEESAKVYRDLFAGITSKTPVRTGHARDSWRIGIGSIDSSTAPEGAGEPEALSQQYAKLFGLTMEQISRGVHITNAVPYVALLEHGHSQQAPAGMVAVTIAEVKAKYGLR